MTSESALTALERLLAIASGPVTRAAPSLEQRFGASEAAVVALLSLLERRNGFYAFESALQVYGAGGGKPELNQWNSGPSVRAYATTGGDALFFAQDVFGGQFALRGDQVCTFDPETGEFSVMAGSLDEWASKLLTNYPELTGYPLAHEWQAAHGPLQPGQRLLARKPFILGGAFDPENLRCEDVESAFARLSAFARQIKDLPDGTNVVVHKLYG